MASWLTRLLRGKSVLVEGVDKLPDGTAKCVELGDPMAGGREIVLARSGGRLFALDRRCPHEGGRLTDGPLFEGKFVVCPLHNYRFEPETGRPVGASCPNARVYKLEESGGDCEIWV